MKFISWNVNGLRACMQKGFLDFFNEVDADFFCVQETKLQEGQIALDLPGYHQFWNYAEKKGYSGTAIFTKHEPLSVSYGIGIPEHDHEGRVITLEYDAFYLVTCYTPNSQNELARLPYRMQWEDDFRAYKDQIVESDAREYAANVTNMIPEESATSYLDDETVDKYVSELDGESNRAPPEDLDVNSKTLDTSDLPADFESKEKRQL